MAKAFNIKEHATCLKCGKEHQEPVDEKMSSENWKVTHPKYECECGGEIQHSFDLLDLSPTEIRESKEEK